MNSVFQFDAPYGYALQGIVKARLSALFLVKNLSIFKLCFDWTNGLGFSISTDRDKTFTEVALDMAFLFLTKSAIFPRNVLHFG